MRFKTILTVFLILMLSPSAWGEKSGSEDPSYTLKAAHSFQIGVDKWYSGDREGAVKAWEEALIFDPKLEEAHYNIGVALRDQEIRVQRENCLSKVDVIECLGSVNHLSQGPTTEIEKALRSLKDATRLNPDHPNAVYLKGVIQGQLKRYNEAEKSLNHHLENNPGDAESHYLLCAAQKAQRKLKRAADSCRKATEIRTDYIEAYHLLGNVYLELQMSFDAATAFEKVVTLHPRSTSAWFNLGMARVGNDQPREAVDAYKRALDINIKNGAAHLNLGVVYDMMNEGSLAIDHTRQAQQLFSDSKEWRRMAQAENNLTRFMKKYMSQAHHDRLF